MYHSLFILFWLDIASISIFSEYTLYLKKRINIVSFVFIVVNITSGTILFKQTSYYELVGVQKSIRAVRTASLVALLMFIISVRLLWLAGLYMTCVLRREPLLKPVRKPVLNCQNLANWFSYIAIWWNQFEGSWRFDAHQCNTWKFTRDYIKITLFLYRSLCLHEWGLWHFFWSSDLCT